MKKRILPILILLIAILSACGGNTAKESSLPADSSVAPVTEKTSPDEVTDGTSADNTEDKETTLPSAEKSGNVTESQDAD